MKSKSLHLLVIGLLTSAVAGLVIIPAPVWASSTGDKCSDVLRGDIRNQISTRSEKSQAAQAAATEMFYQMNANDAWSKYKDEQKNTLNQDISAHVDVNIGMYGGSADFASKYGRDLSENQFKEQFSKSQSMRQQNKSSSSSNQASDIELYASTVRDRDTIQSWERCMRNNSAGEGLIAYGHRDESGNPFITVLWAPGDKIAVEPQVHVRFSVPSQDIEIEGADKETFVATGSGTAFMIRFKDTKNEKIRSNGFAVLVNGQVKDAAGKVVESYQVSATVPRDFSGDTFQIPTSLSQTAASPSASGMEYNTDRPGSDYRGFDLDREEPALCKQACDSDGQCTAWTYGKPGVYGPNASHCWLKTGVPAARPNACCVSGLKASVAASAKPRVQGMEYNTDRPGSDYRGFDLDREEPALCKQACDSDGKCTAWTYGKPGVYGPNAPHCWLKTGVPAAKPNTCCVSGLK